MTVQRKPEKAKARIVQMADEGKTLPDGSKILYAESDDKIMVYHKVPFGKNDSYVYERKTGKIFLNGKEGDNAAKRKMIQLGTYMLDNSKDDELVTVNVFTKDEV